jgi:hypothetical protein
MTEVLGPSDPEAGPELLGIDLEIAGRKLELSLRRVLAGALVSQPTLELLSLHYLRLQMRPRDAAGVAGGGRRRHQGQHAPAPARRPWCGRVSGGERRRRPPQLTAPAKGQARATPPARAGPPAPRRPRPQKRS